MRHTTRQLGKRLHRTQRHSKTEQVQVVEHVSRINARHDLEAQHATGPLETFGSQTLVACAGQTRVMHRLNQRMHQQVAGDGIGILLLTIHAKGQRLNAAAHRVALSRSQHTTQTVLREVHAARQILTGNDHQTGVHIRMTGQILGGGVNHHIRTQRKRLLQVRGHERVVHNRKRPETVGHRGDGAHVVHLE